MTGQDDPRHNLRLTKELKLKLHHAAIDNGRSVNAEILARLERSFAPDPASQLAAAVKSLTDISEQERLKVIDHLMSAVRIVAKGKGDSSG